MLFDHLTRTCSQQDAIRLCGPEFLLLDRLYGVINLTDSLCLACFYDALCSLLDKYPQSHEFVLASPLILPTLLSYMNSRYGYAQSSALPCVLRISAHHSGCRAIFDYFLPRTAHPVEQRSPLLLFKPMLNEYDQATSETTIKVIRNLIQYARKEGMSGPQQQLLEILHNQKPYRFATDEKSAEKFKLAGNAKFSQQAYEDALVAYFNALEFCSRFCCVDKNPKTLVIYNNIAS